MGSGLYHFQIRVRACKADHQPFTDRVLCGEMARVDQVDPLPLRIQELVIAQICGDKGIASCGNRRIHQVSAGAAAHRYTGHRASCVRPAHAVAAKPPADKLGKVRKGQRYGQLTYPSQSVLAKGLRIGELQRPGQRIVDAANRHIQIRVHADGGNIAPQQR